MHNGDDFLVAAAEREAAAADQDQQRLLRWIFGGASLEVPAAPAHKQLSRSSACTSAALQHLFAQGEHEAVVCAAFDRSAADVELAQLVVRSLLASGKADLALQHSTACLEAAQQPLVSPLQLLVADALVRLQRPADAQRVLERVVNAPLQQVQQAHVQRHAIRALALLQMQQSQMEEMRASLELLSSSTEAGTLSHLDDAAFICKALMCAADLEAASAHVVRAQQLAREIRAQVGDLDRLAFVRDQIEVEKAMILMMQNDLKACSSVLSEVARRSPDHVPAAHARAACLFRMNDVARAIRVLENAVLGAMRLDIDERPALFESLKFLEFLYSLGTTIQRRQGSAAIGVLKKHYMISR